MNSSLLQSNSQDPCSGCCHAIHRRHFLQRCGAAVATAGTLGTLPFSSAAEKANSKVRVAAVFLMSMQTHEIWPYPKFNTKARQQVILDALRKDCPNIEFIPVALEQAEDLSKAIALKDQVDGYLVYTMTLVWSQGNAMVSIGKLGKPMVVADEILGGSGVFLTRFGGLRSQGIHAVGVSTTKLDQLAAVVRQFGRLRQAQLTPAQFAAHCERVYHETFPERNRAAGAEDPVALTDIGECVKRFKQSRFLIVGRGNAGVEKNYLGAKGRYIDFGELQSLYKEVDLDEAKEWANRWSQEATTLPDGEYVEPRQPTSEAIHKSGGIYLATKKLLEKYGTDTVTMNCLGGFASGHLAAYPCLGFMQILNDGGQGVCEAMPDDTMSMLMARILTGRPGFVSDPALDTSQNQILYAHCVGTTKVFGPDGKSNDYHIRTLHNRDPRGACSESLMPAGYMTTSFRTNFQRKLMVIHQAKSTGTLDSEYGCRTKLLAEVRGDIGKMFDEWHQFSWHRVTVYGDVMDPLAEFGEALGLKVIREA